MMIISQPIRLLATYCFVAEASDLHHEAKPVWNKWTDKSITSLIALQDMIKCKTPHEQMLVNDATHSVWREHVGARVPSAHSFTSWKFPS